MKKEIFVTTVEELEELECNHELEDCGMSGKDYGWHWYAGKEVDVYFKLEEEIEEV